MAEYGSCKRFPEEHTKAVLRVLDLSLICVYVIINEILEVRIEVLIGASMFNFRVAMCQPCVPYLMYKYFCDILNIQ